MKIDKILMLSIGIVAGIVSVYSCNSGSSSTAQSTTSHIFYLHSSASISTFGIHYLTPGSSTTVMGLARFPLVGSGTLVGGKVYVGQHSSPAVTTIRIMRNNTEVLFGGPDGGVTGTFDLEPTSSSGAFSDGDSLAVLVEYGSSSGSVSAISVAVEIEN